MKKCSTINDTIWCILLVQGVTEGHQKMGKCLKKCSTDVILGILFGPEGVSGGYVPSEDGKILKKCSTNDAI